jgi:hypothetical protein
VLGWIIFQRWRIAREKLRELNFCVLWYAQQAARFELDPNVTETDGLKLVAQLSATIEKAGQIIDSI